MKNHIKCEMCSTELHADTCVFATRRSVIKGKEHTYCCVIIIRKHMHKGSQKM